MEQQEKTEENSQKENYIETEDKKEIKEKVSKKLRELQELRNILNISNCALRFKANITQIIHERIEKNINMNNSSNNYYTKVNSSTDVFKYV